MFGGHTHIHPLVSDRRAMHEMIESRYNYVMTTFDVTIKMLMKKLAYILAFLIIEDLEIHGVYSLVRTAESKLFRIIEAYQFYILHVIYSEYLLLQKN